MFKIISEWWNKYELYYLVHYSLLGKSKKDGLPYLRDKLFISVLLLSLPIGLLAYIPSIIISIKFNALVIGIYDTIALLVVIFILFYKGHSIQAKKIIFSANIYILATILLLFLGSRGPGIVMFFCATILITLFHSKKAGIISLIVNAAIYFSLLPGFYLKNAAPPFFDEFTIASWLVVASNIITFNFLIVIAVSFVVEHLQKSFLNEQHLQVLLKKESLNLLKAKIKSEEADRLKSAFLANMSHEIRTPMNGLIGFASLLKEPMLSGEEQKNYINIIEKSGKRMLTIINDIVDISKIESGMMEVNHTATNINEKIEYIYTFFKPEAEGKGLRFSFKNELTSNEAIISTDKEKFIAILTNLVKNAIKFTHTGHIEFGYSKKGDQLEFYVTDTGVGVPTHRQEAIFERFIQADLGDKHVYQGAGLGLSITKAYVEMLGGKLWMNSTIGRGSTFYFTIPYVAKPVADNEEKSNLHGEINEAQFKIMKILVVEDDETSDLLITTILNKLNAKVIHAKNGVEAIDEIYRDPDIDLILMDIKMPLMDGYEATAQIRQINKDVVIIAQTAYGLLAESEKAIEVGCNDYISKPIAKEKLLKLIQKYVIK